MLKYTITLSTNNGYVPWDNANDVETEPYVYAKTQKEATRYAVRLAGMHNMGVSRVDNWTEE